jgi:hypothetical protein
MGSVSDMRRMLAAESANEPPRGRQWVPGHLPLALANYAANPVKFRRSIEYEAHDASMLEWKYRNGAAE